MTLSSQAHAVIGNQHPVAFAAAHLGFKSPAAFIRKMAQGKVKPEQIPSYVQAVESGKRCGKTIIPFFTFESIEQAAAELAPAMPVQPPVLTHEATAPPKKKSKRRLRRDRDRRCSVSRKR